MRSARLAKNDVIIITSGSNLNIPNYITIDSIIRLLNSFQQKTQPFLTGAKPPQEAFLLDVSASTLPRVG